MKKTVEIGKQETVFDKRVTCKEASNGCTGCKFQDVCDGTRKDRPACMAHERADKTSVIFK